MKYQDFLRSKIDIAQESGLQISPDEINPILLPHQIDAVIWAIRKGRGVELNTDYFRDGLGYMMEIEQSVISPTLFEVESIAV